MRFILLLLKIILHFRFPRTIFVKLKLRIGMELTSGVQSFKELCEVFEKVQGVSSRDDKIHIWKQFTEKFNSDLYLAIRLAVPKLDSKRKSYGLKENALAQKFISALCLSKSSPEAKRLIKFKSAKGTRDFPEALYAILRNRCSGNKQYSLQEINNLLDSICLGVTNHNLKVILKNLLDFQSMHMKVII